MKKWFVLAGLLLLPVVSAGCLVVGRSSRGGWFIWPGGLTLLVLLVIILLLRRRR